MEIWNNILCNNLLVWYFSGILRFRGSERKRVGIILDAYTVCCWVNSDLDPRLRKSYRSMENTWIVKFLKTCFHDNVEKGWAKGPFLIAVLLIVLLILFL